MNHRLIASLAVASMLGAVACSSSPEPTDQAPAESAEAPLAAEAPKQAEHPDVKVASDMERAASGFGYSITPGYCTYCWKLEDQAASFCQSFGWQLGQNECFHGGCTHYNHISFSCR